jgi:hypothetical protein
MNRLITMAFAILLMFPAAALSQTRSRTTSRKTPKPSAATAANAVRTEGANRVATQIKDLTRFVYLLGGVAKGIEQVDEAARHNEAPPTAVAQNIKYKATVKAAMQNVREGLDQLEIYFRSTPEVEGYYTRLAGSAAGAASAEDQAAAGHFDQAGRTLLDVVNRLTDVLLAMR